MKKIVGIFVPMATPFHFNGEARYLPSAEMIKWNSELRLDHGHQDLVELTGNIRTDGEVSLAEGSEKKSIVLISDLKMTISKFQRLVTKLKKTKLAIPAPANQLRGPVVCFVKGEFSTEELTSQFPFGCDVGLKSEEQRLMAEIAGKLKLENSPKGMIPDLNLDVKIDGIDLVLPTIEIGASAPAISPDPRIVLRKPKPKIEKKKEDDPIGFKYKVRVRTLRENSIQIHSNLAKTPVPISVDASLSHDSPLSGSVNVDQFTVELLRRKAEVKYFKVKLKENPEDQTLKGLIIFPNNDYRITMKIFGSAASPEYTFESEPPLPQNQLMAVLLFGKLPDSLDTDKQRTAEETRAAVADGAVNLLSMYYLAATPVESVGYNPHSGVFSAKVNLQDGLSMTVGTDTEDQREIGLRRRLGKGWSVETMAISNQQNSSRKGVAMLKWGQALLKKWCEEILGREVILSALTNLKILRNLCR